MTAEAYRAPPGSVPGVRRPSVTDLMLLAAVSLWAFNFTVTRFVLTHGFQPVAYSVVRYGIGAVLLLAIAWRREGSLWIARRDLPLLLLTAFIGISVNQVTFVYSLHYTTATTVALLFGATPVFAMAIAAIGRIEVFSGRFVLVALASLAGVALVALGSGSGVSGNLTGDLLGIANAATFALYTVAIVPLMRRYSPFRISALIISIGTIGVLPIGIPQLAHQSFHLRPLVWGCVAFGIIGSLVVTQLLWYSGVAIAGPSRATLFSNAQPFIGAVFALALLSEPLHLLEVVGGLLIGIGIAGAPRARAVPLTPAGE
jgi:drug/metabolite transporter (DMT)-like permease